MRGKFFWHTFRAKIQIFVFAPKLRLENQQKLLAPIDRAHRETQESEVFKSINLINRLQRAKKDQIIVHF